LQEDIFDHSGWVRESRSRPMVINCSTPFWLPRHVRHLFSAESQVLSSIITRSALLEHCCHSTGDIVRRQLNRASSWTLIWKQVAGHESSPCIEAYAQPLYQSHQFPVAIVYQCLWPTSLFWQTSHNRNTISSFLLVLDTLYALVDMQDLVASMI
jgi:hypothetical protein